MADAIERLKAAIASLQTWASMRLSGRITKHLFDPLTLIGGVAVLVLVVLLLVLGFGGSDEVEQRKRGAQNPASEPVTTALRQPGLGDDWRV